MEIQGKVKFIGQTEVFGQNGFQKRDFKCKLALRLGFKYDSVSGKIITPTGKESRKLTKGGYTLLTLRENGYTYYLLGHQFAWYSYYNTCVEIIDHINGDKADNRIVNLRAANKSINALNTNKTGVYFCKRSKRYIANITINYKHKHLGAFKTYEEARNKYLTFKENIIQWKLQAL